MIADPYLTYKFHVFIDGVLVAGFTEVSAITVETEVDRGRAGGMNQSEYALVGPTKYSDVTLKQGLSMAVDFFAWHQNVIRGVGIRMNLQIVLLDNDNITRASWMLLDAFPLKWVGPALRGNASELAIAEITFAHNGIVREMV